MGRLSRLDVLLVAIAAACLVAHLEMVAVGWNHSLLDHDGFRQTQTALTAQTLLQGGPVLRYETPVLGPPWSIPFEFPLYQWTVAKLSALGKVSLQSAGRAVSEAMFLLTLAALAALLAAAGIPPLRCAIFLALVLVSPLYLFWSRTFMIESTALFFGASYLACVAWYCRGGSPWWLAGAALSGALCGMVKATSLAGFLVLAAVALAAHARRVPPALAVLAVPVLATLGWTRFADSVKALNPIGAGMTTVALRVWNFGTFTSRFAPRTWAVQLGRTLPDSVGHWIILLLAAAAVLAARRRRALFGLSLLAYAVGPFVFTNLHFVHRYYAYANGIFLCTAAGFGVLALLEAAPERGRAFTAAAMILLGVAVLASLRTYAREYYPLQEEDNTGLLPLASTTEAATRLDEVILVYGLSWSPELPYYSRRRALMWPGELEFTGPLFEREMDNLRRSGLRVGAVLFCAKVRVEQRPLLFAALDHFRLGRVPLYEDEHCSVFRTRLE